MTNNPAKEDKEEIGTKENNTNNEATSQEEVALEIETIKNQLQESENKYLRALAEAENMRKRYEKTQADLTKYAVADFAKEIIYVLDIFDKALKGIEKARITDDSFKNFVFGIELTQKELEKAMGKFQITKIDCLEKKFDGNFHESLYAKEDKSKENGTIIEIIEDGYKIHDRLLRPAKVGIVKNN